jgi:hypothetical protein
VGGLLGSPSGDGEPSVLGGVLDTVDGLLKPGL